MRIAIPSGARHGQAGELTLVYAGDTSCEGRSTAPARASSTAAMVIRTALDRTPANLELWATYLVPGQRGHARAHRCGFARDLPLLIARFDERVEPARGYIAGFADRSLTNPVEPAGLEPATSCLPGMRSPS